MIATIAHRAAWDTPGVKTTEEGPLMICPDCHGKGGHLMYEPGLFNTTCTTCGGHGVVHCCEGDQEHPTGERPTGPPPRSGPQPATAPPARSGRG